MIRALRPLAVIVLAGFMLAAPPALAREGALERFNVWADGVNRTLSREFVGPLLDGAHALPPPLHRAAGNLYANLVEPVSAFSWAMAGEAGPAARSAGRFAINSTAGLLGLFDPASALGLAAEKRHFTQGICALGIPAGRYLVVPGVGPSATGVFASAMAVMIGSTYALSFLSLELALASAGVDIIGTAAALEGLATGDAEPVDADHQRATYLAYLRGSGCDVD
ncbi:MAG TPA: MlaA family lipoprotein [Azospirillum sp.]